MFSFCSQGAVMADDTNQGSVYPKAADVDAVLAEFAGDARAAIAALLADVDALAREQGERVSFGYVRGEASKVRRRRP